ncbi:33480_t:CDS:2 [Gigaspora margarita]|uniref:33480_t:CDS:1 n=1 Tax=Gigaspora margarita TaxID=4874 RepID=A0ABN7VJG2_GIGMA|nr:33480_t:CDS:2 [Gigaspora margarita]
MTTQQVGCPQKKIEKNTLEESEQFPNMMQSEENNMMKVAQIPKEDSETEISIL